MHPPARLLFVLLSVAVSSAPAMDTVKLEPKLEPNAMLSFEFPDLPETYFAHFHKVDGQKHPAKLTAQLPENYSPSGKFPLFLFLSGRNGGPGDNAAFVRRIIGSRDYIAVNVPLFKDTTHPAPAFLDSIPKPKQDPEYQTERR